MDNLELLDKVRDGLDKIKERGEDNKFTLIHHSDVAVLLDRIEREIKASSSDE